MERYVVLTGKLWTEDKKDNTYKVTNFYGTSCHIRTEQNVKWWVDLKEPTGDWGGTLVNQQETPDKLDDIKKIIEEALLNEEPFEDAIMAILNVIDRKS